MITADCIDEICPELGIGSEVIIKKSLFGKSSASVFLVDVRVPELLDAIAILKVEKIEEANSAHADEDEASLHLRATNVELSYAEKHFPKLLCSGKTPSFAFAFYSIAADGLENCRLLSTCPSSIHGIICTVVSKEILLKWNKSKAALGEIITESELLTCWLGKRLSKSEGGRIESRLNKIGVSQSNEGFSFFGSALPNPLHWAKKGSFVVDGGIRPLVGAIHGDLHSQNIIVDKSTGPTSSYSIIDFALFKESMPLLFDHAYLELDILMEGHEIIPMALWISELDKLHHIRGLQDINVTQIDTRHITGVEAITRIRHEVKSWVSQNFPNRKSELFRQELLARVAAGLNFLNRKTYTSKQQIYVFIYASLALKKYFEFCDIQFPNADCVLNDPALADNGEFDPNTLVPHLDVFDTYKHDYILVSSLSSIDIRSRDLSLMAQPKWSVVVDLQGSVEQGSFEDIFYQDLRKQRIVNIVDCGQGALPLGGPNSTLWLKSPCLSILEGSSSNQRSTWKRIEFGVVRRQIREYVTREKPLSMKIIVLDCKYEAYAIDAVCSAFLEESGLSDVEIVWLDGGSTTDIEYQELVLPVSGDSVDNLNEYAEYCLGRLASPSDMNIPCRVGEKPSAPVQLNDVSGEENIVAIQDELEILHAGKAYYKNEDYNNSFLRGALISWPEIDMFVDVPRSLAATIEAELVKKLSENDHSIYELRHRPGAGASTIARRVLWNLKERYPCVVLKRISSNSAARIESLFRITQVPILVLADADTCSVPDAHKLISAAEARHFRVCIFTVSRTSSPSAPPKDTRHRADLTDVMPAAESKLFFGKYASDASDDIRRSLDELTHKFEMQKFRSPFFYGLYRFEKNFIGVPDYVSRYLEDHNGDSIREMALLCLSSAYTQTGISERVVSAFFDVEYTPGSVIEKRFGIEAGLILTTFRNSDEYVVRTCHPLLAQEVLEQYFQVKRSTDIVIWRAKLSQLTQDLIISVKSNENISDEDAIAWFVPLLVTRSVSSFDVEARDRHSPLIMELEDDSFQRQVFALLTKSYPSESHFWHHFGRHSAGRSARRYKDAIEQLDIAISIDSEDYLHRQQIGVIYTRLVNEDLDRFGKNSGSENNAWSEISSSYLKGRNSFELARLFSDESSAYPFHSDAFLVVLVIRRLVEISKSHDFAGFMRANAEMGDVLSIELSSADHLHSEAKQIISHGELPTTYSEDVERRLIQLLRSSEQLLQIMRERIRSAGGDTIGNRRFMIGIAEQSRQRLDNSATAWSAFDEELLSMSKSNIGDAASIEQDYRQWFSIYRRSPKFSLIEAIDKVNQWHSILGSKSSAFHRFILYFLEWYEGTTSNSEFVRRAREDCRAKTNGISQSRVLECLGKNVSEFPLIDSGALGEWDFKKRFFEKTHNLARIEGVVDYINSPKSGAISVIPTPFEAASGRSFEKRYSIDAFFVPGEEFLRGSDENVWVTAYLSFTRGGLVASSVKRR